MSGRVSFRWRSLKLVVTCCSCVVVVGVDFTTTGTEMPSPTSVAFLQVVQSGVGESAEVIRRVFALARLCSPSVVFLDELQAIVGAAKDRSGSDGGGENSKQLLTQLLLELDTIAHKSAGVCVLGATNMPGSLDPSLLVPGRFDVIIEVGLPSQEDRVRRRLMVVC